MAIRARQPLSDRAVVCNAVNFSSCKVSLLLGVGLVMAAGPAYAHRPYFTEVERIMLPNGQPGEMRLLHGDGIFVGDPVRIVVLDQEQRLLALSPQYSFLTLICDKHRAGCVGYDGISALVLDPLTFRTGGVVPGTTSEERSDLWGVQADRASWGFLRRLA